MTQERYWVVGGEYSCMAFKALKDGAPQVLGPFEDRDPFTRLAVEFLARTGLRKSEFLDLTVDSVVQIGSAYWLHVPLGKLRTDRYIPLHPQLKEMLDDGSPVVPPGCRSRGCSSSAAVGSASSASRTRSARRLGLPGSAT